jgi:hypothetical protein
MTGDPRIVTESPTLSGLVVMPIVSHKPTLSTTQTAALVSVVQTSERVRSLSFRHAHRSPSTGPLYFS